MKLVDFKFWIARLRFGKRLPTAVYIARPTNWSQVPPELAATVAVERAMTAAQPDSDWNLLKLHTDQLAITFLTYPEFDEDPHPTLAEATKIHLGTGNIVRTEYRKRSNPPILHRKEAFLPPQDPRHATFRRLTEAEEQAGLYRDTSQIGHRLHWQTLLVRKGLRFDGHILVRAHRDAPAYDDPQSPDPKSLPVERHRTAIRRYDLSKPVKLALERGILCKSRTFFDYGCGHGLDIEGLESLGFTASGWDPAFRGGADRHEADVVNLGYVLNVIENPAERDAALRAAFALARHALIVSTLVSGQETAAHTTAFGDGFLTKTNTFQKFYAPGELESLLEEELRVEAITLSFGICVAFKDPKDAEAFQASRNRRRLDWTQIGTQLAFTTPVSRQRSRAGRYDLHRDLLDAFWSCLLELGRTPEPILKTLRHFIEIFAGFQHAKSGFSASDGSHVGLTYPINGIIVRQMASQRKASLPDDLVGRRNLAKKPPLPLQSVLHQAAASHRWRERKGPNFSAKSRLRDFVGPSST